MKYKLTIKYEISDAAYDTEDKDKILNTEQWLLSIGGISKYILGLCRSTKRRDYNKPINASVKLEENSET